MDVSALLEIIRFAGNRNDYMKNYLISYPRSGNSWVRYIIETISGQPTFDDNDNAEDFMIQKNTGSPILIKNHKIKPEYINKNNRLILLIRNYKEAFTRHWLYSSENKKEFNNHLIKETGNEFGESDYINLIDCYDSWPGEKMIIYYEDLILNPIVKINELCSFLKINNKDSYNEFIKNFEKHKKISIDNYLPGSISGGNEITFHSNNLDKNQIRTMDFRLMTNFPKLFSKYLNRYLTNSQKNISDVFACLAGNRNDYMKNYMAQRYHSKRNSIINQLGGKCKSCGSKENLHLDHKDAKKKKFRASDLHSVNDSDLKEELKNLQLLCSDCHKAKTKDKWDYAVNKPQHGTYWNFRAHGCRCPQCTEAYKEKIKEWKSKK